MAGQGGLTIRTALEYTAIITVLIAFFGGSKIQSLLQLSTNDSRENALVSQDKLDSIVYPDPELQCPDHPLDIHIFSRAPLIIYIPNFISGSESQHLIDLS